MLFSKDLVCPVFFEKIDSNVSRLSVFLEVIMMAVYLITLNPVWITIVAIEYCINAFGDSRYSLTKGAAKGIVKALNLRPNFIDKGQKVFAARLGFICAALGLVFFILGNMTASLVITAFLFILATADSVFNLCLGCAIYNYLVYPFVRGKS